MRWIKRLYQFRPVWNGLVRAFLFASLLMLASLSIVVADGGGSGGLPGSGIAPGVRGPLADQPPVAVRPFAAPLLTPDVLYDINLSVPLFSQNDSAWSGNTMQTCGHSIGSYGCTLTSAAMVFKYYGAVNKNPGQLNTCMGNSACPWYWATGANNCSESKATWYNSYNFDYGTLVWALEAGWPPILYLTNGDLTHFVVVKSIYGDGQSDSQYRIADPVDGTVKALSNYTSNGWSKNNIYVYSKR